MTIMIRAWMGEPREDTQTHLEWGSGSASWLRVILLRLMGYVMVWPNEKMGVREQVGAGRSAWGSWTKACLVIAEFRAPCTGSSTSEELRKSLIHSRRPSPTVAWGKNLGVHMHPSPAFSHFGQTTSSLCAWTSSSVKREALVRIKGDNAHRALKTSLEPSVQSVDVCFYDRGPGSAGNRKQGSLPPCILLNTENNAGNK